MIYTVKSGDSLSKIARDVLGNMSVWPEIARLNNISSPYIITPGQQLTLPGASTPAAAPSAVTSPSPIVTRPSVSATAPAPARVTATAGPAIMEFLRKNYLWIAGGIAGIMALSLLAPAGKSVAKKGGKRARKKRRK